MQKNFSYIYPFLMLLILVAVSGCSPAQKPISDDQGVVYFLKQVEDSAAQERWQEARESVDKLEEAWRRDRDRLLTSRTQEKVESFENSLEKLKKEVRERDKKDTAKIISSMRNDYRDITSP